MSIINIQLLTDELTHQEAMLDRRNFKDEFLNKGWIIQ